MADAKIVDIKGVQWELKDQKARNDLALIKERPYIIEEDMNSANKYRKWSDGVLEQWFTVPMIISRNSSFKINFPIKFDEVPIELNSFVKAKYSITPVGVFAPSNEEELTGSGCSLLFISIHDYKDVPANVCVYAKGIKKST